MLELAAVTGKFIAFLLQINVHDATAQLTIQSHRREADPGSSKVACQFVFGHLYRNCLKRLDTVFHVHNPHDRHLGLR